MQKFSCLMGFFREMQEDLMIVRLLVGYTGEGLELH